MSNEKAYPSGFFLVNFNIVWLHSGDAQGENYGNFLQRVLKPCALWQNDSTFKVTALGINDPLAESSALKADLLIIIQCHIVWLWPVIQLRKHLGRRTIFEINDDIAELGDWLNPNHALKSPLVRQHLLNLASACDAVQFSSQGLADRYACLHKDRYILDPWVEAPTKRCQSTEKFIVGWGGSSSHVEDLLDIAPAIAEFLLQNPNAQFAVMGSQVSLQIFLDLLPPNQVSFYPFGDEQAYFSFLRSLDVGIAPMRETAFNKGRSDGKFVQYAINGCAAVLADVSAFSAHRGRACFFKSPSQLLEILNTLFHDRSILQKIVASAHSWVAKERSPNAVRERMRAIFVRFLPSMPQPVNYFDVPWNADKRQKWNVLMNSLATHQHTQVIGICESLLQEKPDFSIIRWYLMRSQIQCGQYEKLYNTVKSAPHDAVWNDEFMTLAHAVARKQGSSLQGYFRQNIIHPLKQLQADGINASDPESYFRAILVFLPYDYFSLFGLIRILQKTTPASRELPPLIRRADLLNSAPKN